MLDLTAPNTIASHHIVTPYNPGLIFT